MLPLLKFENVQSVSTVISVVACMCAVLLMECECYVFQATRTCTQYNVNNDELVFSIMETLLLNAKLKLFRVGDSHGVELCDT